MAETDRFLFAALAQSECLSESMAAELAMKDVSSDVLIATVGACLRCIQQADVGANVAAAAPIAGAKPMGVAARHRVGSQLANALKELGFAGDCGYNHFLYPSEKDTRNILSWLVGKLPRVDTLDGAKVTASPTVTAPILSVHSGMVARAPIAIDVLAEESIQSIFSAWTATRTLPVWPNRQLTALRGFQCVPLRTSPLRLPWHSSSSAVGESREEDTNHPCLFTRVPRGTCKAISLLECMAVHNRSSDQRSNVDVLMIVDDLDIHETTRPSIGSVASSPIPVRSIANGAVNEDGDHNDEKTSERISVDGCNQLVISSAPLYMAELLHPQLNEVTMDQTDITAVADSIMKAQQEEGFGVDPMEHVVSATDRLSKGILLVAPAISKQKTEDLEKIQSCLADTLHQIQLIQEEADRAEYIIRETGERVEQTTASGVMAQRKLTTHMQLSALLPQGQAGVDRLERVCSKSKQKLDQLSFEWEKHRMPLEHEETRLHAVASNRKSRCQQFIAEMKRIRLEIKKIAVTVHEKKDMARTLDAILDNLPSGQQRNVYTNRIMDITKQVHKQKQEISKIVNDITSVQKQLNVSSETLKRSEAVTEDKLYSAAQKNATHSPSSAKDGDSGVYVECYRKFAQVRELFEELILVVSDVGKKENATRDLESWITQLQTRESTSQLDNVLADLQTVKDENSTLYEHMRLFQQ